MIRLHPLLAFVVAVAFATASSAVAQLQWTEYRIAGGDFRIEFPAPPKEEVRKLANGSPTYSATLTPNDDTYFSVQATPIASSMLLKPTETLLDIARNAQLRSTKGTLHKEERRRRAGSTIDHQCLAFCPQCIVGGERRSVLSGALCGG